MVPTLLAAPRPEALARPASLCNLQLQCAHAGVIYQTAVVPPSMTITAPFA